MATNSIITRDNLANAAQTTHNDEIISIANVLDEVNPFVQDAPVVESTDMTSHFIARTTSLPSGTIIKVGNGWDASIGTYSQSRESFAICKGRYQCPTDVMKRQPNPTKYRSQRERDAVEGMSQTIANLVISGSTATTPEKFNGLTVRYNTLSSTRTSYVISNGNDAGSDNSSIWFVQWSPTKVYMLYPRGSSSVGLTKEDKGEIYTTGDDSKYLWAYITEFEWNTGLCVEDTRCVKRLCNIDSVLTETHTVDEDKIIQILNNFRGNETVYMYCSEAIYTQLDILAKDKTNVQYLPDSPWGKNIMMFRTSPVKVCDAITDGESIVTV